jgi:outer membrane receptor protein involved in Fe transport
MDVVSFREASRAVNFDYASASAHLFLANSYNQFRDPNQINLRYETAWLSEYLTGHLLAPPGAGPLSQMVSAQEYSRIFDRDGLGFATRTEYLSRGAWRQESSQYGHFGGLDYAVDSLYLSDPGQRRNNDQEQFTISFNAKQQLTRADSIYVQAISYDAHAGDLAQYYDPANSQATLRTRESQHPQLLLGYHHEWQPGSHTLVLAGRLEDTLRASDDFQSVLLLGRGANNEVIAVPSAALPTAALAYRSGLELYSAEVAQIWQHEQHTLVVDGRYQTGWFDTSSQLGASTGTTLSDTTQTTPVAFAAPANSQMAETSLERFATSGYYFWNIVPALQFVGGVAYDLLRFPMNYRNAPISGGSDSRSQFSPKFGATWNVRPGTTARFAYTRSLGGASFDQSVRLEPSQIAGFNQSFRSIIPESVVGSTTGARFETFGLGLDQRFARNTYLTLEGQILRSEVSRNLGAVDVNFPAGFTPSQIRQRLDFEERSVALTLNQLVGESWALGMRYQLADAVLGTRFPEISSSVSTASDVETGAILHETDLFAIFNHRSGFYFRGDAKWWLQDNRGYNPGLPGEDLWQFDLLAGYRFWHRKGQVQIGLLNLTDRDYRLNPLTIHPDLPRARTLTASVQFTY